MNYTTVAPFFFPALPHSQILSESMFPLALVGNSHPKISMVIGQRGSRSFTGSENQ